MTEWDENDLSENKRLWLLSSLRSFSSLPSLSFFLFPVYAAPPFVIR